MEIRRTEARDAEAVFRLLTQFATSYVPRREAFDRQFPRLLESEQAVFLVVEVDGSVVGYLLGFLLPTLYANGSLLELQELMVDPDCRGRGAGSALVAEARRLAWEAGCVEVTVPTRRAAPFYVKLGFEETAVYLKQKLGI